MVTLNHIGIAASNVPELKKLFAILGLKLTHSESVPEQGVNTHFLPFSVEKSGATVELLEPVDPKGTVAQFIAKRGPGIHHLSFTVKRGELDSLCAELKTAGYRLVYDSARSGAHEMRINFIHPGSAGGVLIELMEPKSG